jgi:hypothetical protein
VFRHSVIALFERIHSRSSGAGVATMVALAIVLGGVSSAAGSRNTASEVPTALQKNGTLSWTGFRGDLGFVGCAVVGVVRFDVSVSEPIP